MDLDALFPLLGAILVILLIIVGFAVLAAPIGSFYDPERRHDDWGPQSRRPRSDW
jgi:hypothetical protein